SRHLNVPKLMNFLNRDQNRVNDNWKRLQNLLECFRDGVAPEKSWSTLIATTAVDDPFAQGSPFATLAEDDSDEEEKGQSGDQGDGTQGKNIPGGKDNEVDLTHQDSGASEPSSWKTTPTKKKGCAVLHARSLTNHSCALLDWAMLRGDVMTHNLFPPSALADMLASMMLWNRLDESFWAKYVPEKYYLRSELRLDSLHSEGVRPGYWPDLVDADVRVAQEVMDDASSEHDNVQRDTNYNPDDDVDIQDDDDVQGGDSVPSALKRCRISISSHSDAPATQSTATTGTPSNRMRSGSLRRQSPLAQVDSGSLTVADTDVVEIPGPGISSWVHYGILMTVARHPGSSRTSKGAVGHCDK
ncbi:hypothetical protein PHMEG_00017540, partial [Phytophthora megakarya]